MPPEAEERAAEAEERYESARAGLGMSDVRPLYRRLLRRLRDSDPDRYERAVRRYEEELLPSLAGADDPFGEWLAYGKWLAGHVAPGKAVAVDATGRAEPLGGTPKEGALVLHLPDESGHPAIPLAVPEEPSESQEETKGLLCG